jgi:hypothetical protein
MISYPQSAECQRADWDDHKRQCAPPPPTEPVQGIVIPCQADKHQLGPGIFHTKVIDPKHKIYSKGVVCPLSKQVGLPLVMYRHLREDSLSMRRDAGLDNQIATYLMIKSADGFAPPRYVLSHTSPPEDKT